MFREKFLNLQVLKNVFQKIKFITKKECCRKVPKVKFDALKTVLFGRSCIIRLVTKVSKFFDLVTCFLRLFCHILLYLYMFIYLL